MQVGLREANQRFSTIIKAVRSGKEVMLTERGKPLARLVPVKPEREANAAVRQLEAAGLLRAAANPRPMPSWTPRRIRGDSMTRTLRRERESS
ncbi:MAG TPA: type II toxin-antitoxin system prevent-host-death family antitoxin [Candidatus Binataceae bacterium]|nr:type II toxin-antitoxin system prevent-host-death family antitoxin [Candidatus Binataceae bacterium]